MLRAHPDEAIVIGTRRVVRFKPSPVLTGGMNGR